MTPVFAHPGHWALQVVYLAPLAVLVVMVVNSKRRERREAREADRDGAEVPETDR